MRKLASRALALAAALMAAGAALGAEKFEEDARIARGRYLVTVMDCGGCHTPGALVGQRDAQRTLAGSEVGFGGSAPMGEMTGGVVFPGNLTPDAETGLGRWSEAEIVRALRQGLRPDGRPLVPVMPWPAFQQLTDEDASAIAAYLKSLPPVRNAVPANVPPGQTSPAPYLKVVRDGKGG